MEKRRTVKIKLTRVNAVGTVHIFVNGEFYCVLESGQNIIKFELTDFYLSATVDDRFATRIGISGNLWSSDKINIPSSAKAIVIDVPQDNIPRISVLTRLGQ